MKFEDLSLDLEGLDLAALRLDQYSGWACIEPVHAQCILDRVQNMNIHAHVNANSGPQVAAARTNIVPSGAINIEVIQIQGVMTKYGSSLSSAGSTIRIKREIQNAANNPEVDAIMLVIDSPGGMVAGTSDLGRAISQANAKKPVHVFGSDLVASAAYWAASQAGHITANARESMWGSIGTYMGLYDVSGAAEKKGIRAILVKSGEFKGSGFPGVEISDAQIAEWQRIVDSIQSEFTSAVAAGRHIPEARIKELADGRVHTASDAFDMKLIDAISDFKTAMEYLAEVASKSRNTSPKTRSETVTIQTPETPSSSVQPSSMDSYSANAPAAPSPATYADLAEACPGATADFIVAQLASQATKDQAAKAWMAEQQKQIEAANKARLEAEERAQAAADASAGAAAAQQIGVPSAGTGLAASADDSGDFVSLVEGLVAKGKDRAAAVLAIATSRPDLHQAYLAETNPSLKARRLLSEKYDPNA